MTRAKVLRTDPPSYGLTDFQEKLSARLNSPGKRVEADLTMDFHDDVGNQVARLKNCINILWIQRRITESVYTELNKCVSDVVEGTRSFLWSLDHQDDRLSSVFSRLAQFGEALFTEQHVSFKYLITGIEHLELQPGHARQVSLIFKEAITNTFKHAQAQHVVLRVTGNGKNNSVVLTIALADDGIGIRPRRAKDKGYGLSNMQCRAKNVGGDLKIVSSQKGTCVELTMPLNPGI